MRALRKLICKLRGHVWKQVVTYQRKCSRCGRAETVYVDLLRLELGLGTPVAWAATPEQVCDDAIRKLKG